MFARRKSICADEEVQLAALPGASNTFFSSLGCVNVNSCSVFCLRRQSSDWDQHREKKGMAAEVGPSGCLDESHSSVSSPLATNSLHFRCWCLPPVGFTDLPPPALGSGTVHTTHWPLVLWCQDEDSAADDSV